MFTPVQVAAIRSYFVSVALGFWSALRGALSVGIVMGSAVDFKTALLYIFSAKVFFLILCSSFLDIGPYYRANQGVKNFENTTPPNGTCSNCGQVTGTYAPESK